jgi:cytosine/adenosine deaminase-related metal-dependent hydrolase
MADYVAVTGPRGGVTAVGGWPGVAYAPTRNAALFRAKPEQCGVVEAGHVADLVLLEANPLEDIRDTRKTSAVVVAGTYYSRKALDNILEQVGKTAAKQ